MKNKILVPLLFVVTLALGYCLFINHNEANTSLQRSNTISSKDLNTDPNISTSYKTNETPSNIVKASSYPINKYSYHASNNDPDNNNQNISNDKEKNVPSNSATSNNNRSKKIIAIPDFLNNLKCSNYVLSTGETLTQIARKYENTCNLNTSIKIIKSINNINDADNIHSGTTLFIPEATLKSGTMYKIITGDTWYSIINKYYYGYDVESMNNLLVYINDLPNNDLPLGESIYLPSI